MVTYGTVICVCVCRCAPDPVDTGPRILLRRDPSQDLQLQLSQCLLASDLYHIHKKVMVANVNYKKTCLTAIIADGLTSAAIG